MQTLETKNNGTLIKRVEADYDTRRVSVWEEVDGIWTQTVDRAMTTEEIAAQSATSGEKTTGERIAQAIKANKTFLALASPTNAQAVAEIKRLARQMNALLRLQQKEFDQ